MKRRLMLIAGWAHPGECLNPLAERLEDHFEVSVHPAEPGFEVREPAILLGWSLGGMLSLERAIQQPGHVRALIMVSSTPRFTIAADSTFGTPEANLLQMVNQLKEDVKTTLSGFMAYSALPHRPRVRDLIPQLEALQDGLRYLREKDHRADAPKVRCPVLLIHGRQDAVIPHAASEWLNANLADSKLVSVGNMGHDLILRRPEWIARETRFFINEKLRP